MSRVELQLDDQEKEFWQSEAKKRKMPLSQFIRTSVFFYLKDGSENYE